MIERMDYDAVEAVEQQLDAFITKRARESEEQRRVEVEWAISERRHRERRRERNRALWRSWHLDQAEWLERTARELAADHRARADALGETTDISERPPTVGVMTSWMTDDLMDDPMQGE